MKKILFILCILSTLINGFCQTIGKQYDASAKFKPVSVKQYNYWINQAELASATATSSGPPTAMTRRLPATFRSARMPFLRFGSIRNSCETPTARSSASMRSSARAKNPPILSTTQSRMPTCTKRRRRCTSTAKRPSSLICTMKWRTSSPPTKPCGKIAFAPQTTKNSNG